VRLRVSVDRTPDALLSRTPSVRSAEPREHRRRVARLAEQRELAPEPLPLSSAAVAAIAAIFVAAPLHPASASAALPEIEVQHMAEIEEWVYRNGAAKPPVGCGTVCTGLWVSEHNAIPRTAMAQQMWDGLGQLEVSAGLWASLATLRSEIGTVRLGGRPLRVGWHIAPSSNGQDKWLELVGPKEPPPGFCAPGGASTRLRLMGEEVGQTFFDKPTSPGNEWYLVCGTWEIIKQQVKEKANPTGEACGETAAPPASGEWTRQEWWWNQCYEGFYMGHEALSKVYANAYHVQFHFARPEDWAGQKLEGEASANAETNRAADPGTAAVKTAAEQALESSGALRGWVKWVLEGEHGPSPLAVSPQEEFGHGNAATLNKHNCFEGKPVNCATGNEARLREISPLLVEGPA
jgi:hypothetical protein